MYLACRTFIPDNFIPDSLCNKKGVLYDSGDELALEFSTVNEKVLHISKSPRLPSKTAVFDGDTGYTMFPWS